MEPSRAPAGWRRAAPAGIDIGVAVALVGVLFLALAWQGADWPAHLFRISLVERDGFAVWNNRWFGGHYTLGYSVLVPVLGAFVGAGALAVLSAAAAAALFDQVVVRARGRRHLLASVLFGVGTLTNVLVGRVPFALGLALGLGAVLAAQHRRFGVAVVASLLTPLASPVAGVFLGLVWVAAAWSSGSGGPSGFSWARRSVWWVLAACSTGPVLVMAALYPSGGTFPFRWSSMVWTVAVCAVVALLVPAEHRVVRATTVLYGLSVVAVFLVPSPLGGNVVRLGMFLAAPVLVLLVPVRRWAVLAAIVPLLVGWQWAPALDAVVGSADDPSTSAEFYEPLLGFLDSAGASQHRVEVVPTQRHWETAHVAMEVPIARGWERQLDRRYNEELYDEALTAQEYRAWLHRAGVRYVALADVPLDPGGRAEASLLAQDLEFLELVWASDQWTVWEVHAATDLVDGNADVVHVAADEIVLQVHGSGDLVVRARPSAFWASSPATCIQSTSDGWILLHDATPGALTLRVEGADLVGLDDPCEAGDGT